MYKYAGFGLLGLIVVLLMPVGAYEEPASFAMYGTGTIEQYDSNGNQIFSQTIHNLVTEQGEDYIIAQVFRDDRDTEVNDGLQIGSICITSDDESFGPSQVSGDLTGGDFDGENSLVGNRCISDEPFVEASEGSGGDLTIGPLTFTAGANLDPGQTIAGMGICQANDLAQGESFEDCIDGDGGQSPNGILFATVDFTDVTLGAGETADISYTFDVSEGESSGGGGP